MSERLISADKAKEVLKHLLYETALSNDGYIMDIYEDIIENRLDTWIELIPTAEPMRHGHLGKDIIYRQDAIELAMQYCPDDDGTRSKADEDMRNLLDELEDLPSASTMWVMDKESHRCLTFPKEKGTSVRHGHWARHLDTRFGRKLNDIIICSCCGIAFSTEDMIRRSYCPNCGAKMDERREDADL